MGICPDQSAHCPLSKRVFITNALNSKSTTFFTHMASLETPIAIQFLYCVIISMAHLF